MNGNWSAGPVIGIVATNQGLSRATPSRRKGPVCSQTHSCGGGRAVRATSQTSFCRGEGQSFLELANMLCGMPQETWTSSNTVRLVCCSDFYMVYLMGVLNLFHHIVQIPAVSCGWRIRTPVPRPKGQTVVKFAFWAVTLVPCQQRLTVFFCVPSLPPFLYRCCGRYQVGLWATGSSVVFFSGMWPGP